MRSGASAESQRPVNMKTVHTLTLTLTLMLPLWDRPGTLNVLPAAYWTHLSFTGFPFVAPNHLPPINPPPPQKKQKTPKTLIFNGGLGGALGGRSD